MIVQVLDVVTVINDEETEFHLFAKDVDGVLHSKRIKGFYPFYVYAAVPQAYNHEHLELFHRELTKYLSSNKPFGSCSCYTCSGLKQPEPSIVQLCSQKVNVHCTQCELFLKRFPQFCGFMKEITKQEGPKWLPECLEYYSTFANKCHGNCFPQRFEAVPTGIYTLNNVLCHKKWPSCTNYVREVTYHEANAVFGAELRPRKFMKFQFTYPHLCNVNVLDRFFQKQCIQPEEGLRVDQLGVYDCISDARKMFMRETGIRMGVWIDLETLELCVTAPPKSKGFSKLVYDIETPNAIHSQFPLPKYGIPVASIAYKFNDEVVCLALDRGPKLNEESLAKLPLKSQVYYFETEKQLLNWFHDRVVNVLDPDFMEGFNSNKFDMPYLMARMYYLGMKEYDQWSRLGSCYILRTTFMSKQKGKKDLVKYMCPGRIMSDVYLNISNDNMVKSPDGGLSLGNCCKMFKTTYQKQDMSHDQLWDYFYQGTEEQKFLAISYNILDVLCTDELGAKRNLMDKIVGNAQVFRLFGQEVIDRGVSYYLSCAMYGVRYPHYLLQCNTNVKVERVNALMPGEDDVDDEDDEDEEEDEEAPPATTSQRNIPKLAWHIPQELRLRSLLVKENKILQYDPSQYQGGHVAEPKCGYHFGYFLFLLDFNSLYPSIMMRHNICLSTYVHPWVIQSEHLVEGVHYERAPNGHCFLKKEIKEGFIPKLLNVLVSRRKIIKDDLAANGKTMDFATFQSKKAEEDALKLGANSTYGVCGSTTSELGMRIIADTVCAYGRERYTKRIMELLETSPKFAHLAPRILYGDTDSVFLGTNLPTKVEGKTFEELRQVAEIEFNAMLHYINKESGMVVEPMKLGWDDLLVAMVLVGRKGYVKVSVTSQTHPVPKFKYTIKGLQLIKGDALLYVRHVGTELCERTFTSLDAASPDAVFEFMRTKAQALLLGQVENNELKQTKKMSKDVFEYAGGSEPHVVAAKQKIAAGQTVNSGEYVSFYYVAPKQEDGGKKKKKSDLVMCMELFDPTKHRLDYMLYFEMFYRPFLRLLYWVLGYEKMMALIEYSNYEVLERSVFSHSTKGRPHAVATKNLKSLLDEIMNGKKKKKDEGPMTKQARMDAYFTSTYN